MPSVVNANMRMRLLNEDELDPPNLFEDLRECLAQEGRRSDQMFRQFDIDGTGGVDREEFAIMLIATTCTSLIRFKQAPTHQHPP